MTQVVDEGTVSKVFSDYSRVDDHIKHTLTMIARARSTQAHVRQNHSMERGDKHGVLPT